MLEKYTGWLLRFRWLAIFISIALVALLSSGGRFLTFSNDYEVFFGDTNPQLAAFKNLQSVYTKNDNTLIMLTPADGEVFTSETLQAVAELTEAAWSTPYSSRVDSVTNFQYTYAEEDDLTVTDLIENPEALSESELDQLKQIALSQPLLINRLLSPSADVTGVNITFELPAEDAESLSFEIMQHLQPILDDIEARYPSIQIAKTGMIPMNKAFPEASFNDMQTLIPIAFAIILLGFLLLTRSFWGTLAALLVMLMSIMAAMGTAGWLNVVLTSPSVSAPTLILTLAVADCVHYLVTFLQKLRAGETKYQAIRESVRINFSPIFLTSVTTAIGFLTMNFSDSPPFHDLGNMTAIGVLYAFLLSVFFLPAVTAVLPIKAKTARSRQTWLMESLANLSINHYRKLLIGVGIIIVTLIAMASRNELNDNFVKYFDESIEFRQDTDLISEKLTGMYFIDYSIDSETESGINHPDFLKQLESLEYWLQSQPEVLHVNALSETFRRLNRNMHADEDSWYKLPQEQELAAQYLLLYEMSLPYGLDLNNQINIDKSATRLTATLKNLPTKHVIEFESRVNEWMASNTPSIQTAGSSPTIMFSHISKRNINSMLAGTIIALVLISLVLILALKSLKYGLLSLIPNLVPAGMAFGIWAIFNGQVGLSVSVVIAMTLGIVVDDTIHFLSKYLRARREEGLNTPDAIRYAFSTVGEALLITTIVLTAGFMILAQSNFSLNADMGLMTAITICIALFVDFFFLPPLLIWFDKRQKNSTQQTDGALNPA